MDRRTFITTLPGLVGFAMTRWDEEGITPPTLDDDLDPIDNGIYRTGEFTPEAVTGSGQGPISQWEFNAEDFEEQVLEICYTCGGVSLEIQAKGEEKRDGMLADFSTDQAREIAAALWQAAEERDHRGVEERESIVDKG